MNDILIVKIEKGKQTTTRDFANQRLRKAVFTDIVFNGAIFAILRNDLFSQCNPC